MNQNSIYQRKAAGLFVLLVALCASPACGQTESLRLVESAPVASPPTDSPSKESAPKQFIKQPSKLWTPQIVADPSFSTLAPATSLYQLVSDPKKQAIADLALPPPSPKESTPKAALSELAIPGDVSKITTEFGANTSEPSADSKADGPSVNSGSVATPGSEGGTPEKQDNANKPTTPSFFFPPQQPVRFDCYGQQVPYSGMDFSALPMPALPVDPYSDSMVYRGKTPVMTQRPWVEWGRPLYTPGMYPPANSFFFGETNLLMPHFYVYGDYRTGVGVNQNQKGAARSWAHRLNLDMDLQFTATERLHAFMGPLDRANDVTRLDFSDSSDIKFVDRTDIRLDNMFFEGDVGAILGGREGTYSPFDLPFSVGFMPMVYQNGIWMEDAMIGAACAIPSRHSSALNWPNYEVSLFALTDQVTTDAFKGDNNAAEVFGSAWFIEAYDGYIEADHAFIHDDVGGHRSYHNASISFTRRYLSRLSNSVRFITNFGQALPSDQRTADGYLFLVENSLISSNPNYFVPYANFFYGSGKPQSVARAAGSGGILRNTGINFETDGLTAYPTLDATGNNTYGAAFGLNMLGSNFSQQLVVEFAALGATGSQQFRAAPGDQYAAGVRYQKPLSYRWIFRADSMYGWLRNSDDIFGNRIEFRWKF